MVTCRRFATICAVLLTWTAPVLRAADREVAVTVYNENRGVIRDVRMFELARGTNEISFTEVAALIDPTSVHFKSLTDPQGCTVKEQNFDYDIADDAKMLWKYVGEEVRILAKSGSMYEGTLIGAAARHVGHKGKLAYSQSNAILAQAGGLSIIRLDAIRNFQFVEMPKGLVTKPTLSWKLDAQKGGPHKCEIAYMTSGMDWHADYEVCLSDGSETLDIDGVVTIDNRSGATYPDARLKLVAGKVQMVEEELRREQSRAGMAYAAKAAEAEPQFDEKKFFEYHMYTLRRPATVKDNETKQIDFMSTTGVPFERLYVYDGALFLRPGASNDERYGTACDKRVHVYMKFKNSKANHMGMPLPMGKIRMFCRKGAAEQFIGEAGIDHTPKDEDVLLRIGVANDLIGERVQTSFKRPAGNVIEESFRIALRNHSQNEVEIRIVEHMYRYADWDVIDESNDHIETDSRTIEFHVKVPPDDERVVTYTVRYNF